MADQETPRGLEEKAKSKAHEVRDEAERQAERWTSMMGRRAESLSRALRAARDSLRNEGEERMAMVADQAADQLDRMSGYLEDENPTGMVEDFEDFGRRNPGAFLGTAFTVGLAAGRFLRASDPTTDGDRWTAEHPSTMTEARS